MSTIKTKEELQGQGRAWPDAFIPMSYSFTIIGATLFVSSILIAAWGSTNISIMFLLIGSALIFLGALMILLRGKK